MSSHFREITCKQALNKLHSRRLPYSWDLNIYRGCAHKCEYCFALYTQDYMPDNDFFDTIYIKTNVVEQLEKQLASPSWKREIVNIGGVTDSYPPIVKERNMMPDILKLLILYKTPCIISTKSDLILRDFDLIAELASITYVNVAATITCMDESVRRKIEPGGVPSLRRFQMLKEFAKTDASRGLHMMPIIPYLTDSDENLNALYSHGEDAKVSYALPGLLGLRGRTRRSFFDFIRLEYPRLDPIFRDLYREGRLDQEYRTAFYKRLAKIKKAHTLSHNYMPPKKDEGVQLSLF